MAPPPIRQHSYVSSCQFNHPKNSTPSGIRPTSIVRNRNMHGNHRRLENKRPTPSIYSRNTPTKFNLGNPSPRLAPRHRSSTKSSNTRRTGLYPFRRFSTQRRRHYGDSRLTPTWKNINARNKKSTWSPPKRPKVFRPLRRKSHQPRAVF